MKRDTLVIADGSEDLRLTLKSRFDPVCQVFCCGTGREAIDLIEKKHPDVLMLDLMLPELDGVSLLGLLSATGERPEILAVTAYVSPYLLERAEKLGVRVLIQRPFCLEEAAGILWKLLQERHTCCREDRFSRISGLLLQLGFGANLKGYTYLRDAVLDFAGNPDQSMIKELYSGVGIRYGVSARNVEHSIRSAVMNAWNHSARETWNLYLPENTQRPSSAELIQSLSEYLTGTGDLLSANMF